MEETPKIEDITKILAGRARIGLHLFYVVIFLIVFEILKWVIYGAVIFQSLYLLVTRAPNEPMRRFSNRLAGYAYKIVRYISLNDEVRPFPFTDFPADMEPPGENVSFE